tara:strand:+ start:66060 stop:66731 length:672 start_codon:yes stop_codon:yes gene_type:complete
MDFQILDMEHGLFSFESLDASIRSCELHECSPLVRINGLDAIATQKAMDLGAHGIIFPQVKSLSEVENAVKLTHYAPRGVRGFNPFTRVSDYSLVRPSENRNSNGFALTGVIVETLQAVDELDKILQVPDLDIVYIGSYDLSVALGAPGDMKNPKLMSIVESSIVKIRNANSIAGVMVQDPSEVSKYHKLGANFIVVGVDSFLIGKSFLNIKEQYTRALGGTL